MRLIVYIVTSIIVLSALNANAVSYSPGELLENFYTSRKMMHKTALEIMGYSQLSGAGKRAAEEVLYDYTIIETATSGNSVSYAEVEIKKRSIESGIRVQKEFWKIIKIEGRWVIGNIYTPEDWQIKKAIRSGSSLPEKVEALASFEFEYQVEEVPPGTPIEKSYAYIKRRDYIKAFYWADYSVKQKSDAESYFVRGILHLSNKRQSEGQSDILRAIKLNPQYYYVLQNLTKGSSGGGDSTYNAQDPTTRTMKGGVKGFFQ